MAQNVTVLGANGFLGMHLVAELARSGYTVRAFDRVVKENPLLASNNAVEYIEGDFFNKSDLCATLTDCECCFHLISTSTPKTSNDDPYTDAQSNICGTLRMLDVACSVGVKKLIFASSGGTVYGTPCTDPIDEDHQTMPLCSYGIGKLAIEKYLCLYHEMYGLQHVSLRIANPYGPLQRMEANQGVVGVFLGALLRGKDLHIWGDGTVVRDYLYVGDVARAFVMAMNCPTPSAVINIGSGKGTSLNRIVEHLAQVTGTTPNVRFEKKRGFDVPRSVLNISRAKKELNWEPLVPFEQGLQQTWEWLLGFDSIPK